MALLTIQQATRTGLTPTYTAANSSETIPNAPGLILHVKNGGGSSINVTITSTAVAPVGTAQANDVVAVGAGAEKMISGLLAGAFADPTSGLITIGYSAVTSVTAAVLQSS